MRTTVLLSLVMLALVTLTMPATSSAQVRITVAFGPPPLPLYEQPICPGDGYIWTPGFWAWDQDVDDYYWVPGTWVLAPEIGFLWTPPWWGWSDGVFLFHEGYWGPQVGFYGGIVYGFGYFGYGFEGGRWDHDHFFYNRSVTNINVVNVHNVYNETVVNNVTVNRVSYNGGQGGVEARPRPQDEAAMRERHIGPVGVQTQHEQTARSNPELRATSNHGKPPIAATPRPTEFRDRAVVGAKEAGGPYHPPANRNGNAPRNETSAPSPVHPKELPPFERHAPNSGNPAQDQKYQQQQDKLFAKQEQERQKLQQKQDQEHQRMQNQNPNQPQKQMEQRHQQQTQQLQQRHVQEQQRMQERQRPGKPR